MATPYPSRASVLCPMPMLRWLLIILAGLVVLYVGWRVLGWLRWRMRRPGSLQVLLTGALSDVPAPSGLRSLLRRSGGPDLPGLLELLDSAARDPKVTALLVRIEHLECGLGRAEEMRSALTRFRAAGKPVIVYADELGLAGYWLALGASSVRLPPTGALNVSGVAMEFTLLEGVLERAGVRAQLLARGKYKSMREMFTNSQMSEANREMLTSLVADLSRQLVELTASARQKPALEAQAAIDQGPFRAEEARALGLIDSTQYWDELADELGIDKGKVQSADSYKRRRRRGRLWRGRRGPRVAMVNITGNIRSGHDRQGPNGPRATGHLSFRQALRRVVKSPKIRAIVLRVDSPGGSALASDLMWRELTLAAKQKPILVSMVNVAASGGYYTSALPGVPVWANPSTLTGSIGVVGGKFEFSQLLERLGIGRETIASGPHANYFAASSPWTDEQLAKADRDIEAAYRDFVGKMAEARGLSYDALDAVAQGRVWTGQQARDVSLVDRLGGLWDVQLALKEKLSLPADAPIRWVRAHAPRGLLPRKEDDAAGASEALSSSVSAWLDMHLPGVGEALELARDLRGECLWALSWVYPQRYRR
jgi:protease-4